MSDDVNQSTVFKVGDRVVDAWGNDADESENDGGGVNYNKLGSKDLIAEVNKRNEDREDDAKITFDGKPKKGDVVAALEADDAAQSEDDEEEE